MNDRSRCWAKWLEDFQTPGQAIVAMSASKVPLLLDGMMLGQILDALEVRREAWEKTSAWFRGVLDDPYFVIEECSDAEEANQIAAYYLEIECEIKEQMELNRRQAEGKGAEQCDGSGNA